MFVGLKCQSGRASGIPNTSSFYDCNFKYFNSKFEKCSILQLRWINPYLQQDNLTCPLIGSVFGSSVYEMDLLYFLYVLFRLFCFSQTHRHWLATTTYSESSNEVSWHPKNVRRVEPTRKNYTIRRRNRLSCVQPGLFYPERVCCDASRRGAALHREQNTHFVDRNWPQSPRISENFELPGAPSVPVWSRATIDGREGAKWLHQLTHAHFVHVSILLGDVCACNSGISRISIWGELTFLWNNIHG